MFEINGSEKESLERYKKCVHRKMIWGCIMLSMILFAVVSVVLYLIFNNYIYIYIEIVILIFTFTIYFKTKKLKDISMADIVIYDCDVDLWLYYLDTRKPLKTADHLVEYANTLNLVGKLEEAEQQLSNIEVNQIKNKYNYIAYYVISLENAFYMNDIERVKESKKQIGKLSYPSPTVEEIIKRMQAIAAFYLKYMKEDYSYADDLRVYIKQLSKKNKVKRVQASYLLYLTLLKKGEISLAQVHLKNILKYGGTIFFVKELREDNGKIYHS